MGAIIGFVQIITAKGETGKSCLYIKRLSDVDLAVLRELIVESVGIMKTAYDR
jgi:hypothetical protein